MTTFEILKLIVSALTPIVVAILGILLLRHIEGIKASVVMQSDFRKRWADSFFDSCQDFLVAFERELSLMTVVSGLDEPNGEYGTQLQKEIASLHPTLSELELRIRRSVVFAPKNGADVREAASTCLKLVANLVNSRQGNVDEIIEKMDFFNKSVRAAHAEMIGFAEQSDEKIRGLS